MISRSVTNQSVVFSVIMAAVAGCQLVPGTAVKTAEVVATAQEAAPVTKAQKLGLVKPNGPLPETGFQILGKGRQGIASAIVQIADKRLVADSNGVIEIPQDLIAKGEPLIAAIFADGMVSARKRIMPGQALVLQPVDPATTSITAASGGTAVNSDGTMMVEFGPGALDRDATVRVTRKVSSSVPSYESVHPSFASLDGKVQTDDIWGVYSYHLDLGGAKIQPGASVQVKWKTEPTLQEILKGLDEADLLKDLGVSKSTLKGADGTYYMTMRVPAPEKAQMAAKPSRYSLLGAVCNTVTDVETYYTYEWVQKPYDECEVRIRYLGAGREEYYVALHDNQVNDGHCVYPSTAQMTSCNPWPTYSWRKTITNYRDWVSSTINALVRYQSDDSRINATPISGALVSFSHQGTPVRAATGSAYTATDGYAWGWGMQGASGTASATYPAEPFTWGTSAGYSVNCSTANLFIVKNKGKLALSFNNTGTPVSGSVSVGSSHGNIGLSGFSSQTVTLAHNNTANVTENVTINGGNWTVGGYQVDMNPTSGTLTWNTTNNASLNVWHNATLTALLKYASNDTTVPADQQPATRWHDQPVSGASVNFAHSVSGSSMKPAGRDVLSFTNVNSSQLAWGIRGNNSSVNASVSANGITLSGSNSARIDNTNVTILLNANLPKVVIPFTGDFSDPIVISYTLDGSTLRTISLPAPTGSSISFYVPVEDPLNNPNFHRLSLVSIANRDFSRILAMPDGSTAYTELTDLRRGGPDTTFPETLVATTNAAK